MHACMYVCMYLYIYIYICVYIYVWAVFDHSYFGFGEVSSAAYFMLCCRRAAAFARTIIWQNFQKFVIKHMQLQAVRPKSSILDRDFTL